MELLYIPWFRLEAWNVPVLPGMDEPWFHIPIQPFGVLVAMGVLLGARVAEGFGRRNGTNPRIIADLITHTVIVGFVGSMVLNVVFYETEKLTDPKRLFSTWPGLSSFGGFLSAVAGGWLWRYRRKLPILPIVDALAFALPVGWTFGRMGCFSVHDHPGQPTDFFLAVADYELRGLPREPRHDLGLYEVFWSIACVSIFFLLARTKRRPGFYAALLPILYAPVRFFLDYLRTEPAAGGDVRYAGFTPGQYASVLMLVLGLWLMHRIHSNKPIGIPDELQWTEGAGGEQEKKQT